MAGLNDYMSLNYAGRIQEAGEAEYSWGWAKNLWIAGEEWRASWGLWEVMCQRQSGF